MKKVPQPVDSSPGVRRHLSIGWWGLAVFIFLGLALETMHGLKVNFYLDVRNETRRLMWTLAHAHGTLLSMIHIAWAATLAMVTDRTRDAPSPLITWGLTTGSIFIPLGFFLGGLSIYGGDPGIGVLLVPVGALVLLAAVVAAARYVRVKS